MANIDEFVADEEEAFWVFGLQALMVKITLAFAAGHQREAYLPRANHRRFVRQVLSIGSVLVLSRPVKSIKILKPQSSSSENVVACQVDRR